MFLLSVTVLVGAVCLAEGFLHYIPWRLILNGNELPRPAAYVFGVSGIAVPFTIWLLVYGYVIPVIVIWLVVSGAGVTVLWLYLFDYVLDLIWHKRESDAREQVRAKK